jgi:protocatechuate 3,4-dioxygenase beta subunit
MGLVRGFVAICTLAAFALPASAQLGVQGGRGGGGIGPQGRPLPPRGVTPTETARGTAVIRGSVVAADNGSPVRHAQIRVSGQQGVGARTATTDAQGRFEIRELVAGRYTLNVAKGGFVSLQYGQRRPNETGTPIEVAEGQTVDKILVALPRGSVITGRVSDEFGEPVANAVVSAMRYGYVAGVRRLMPAPGQNARDTTDDQGQFRLFGLPPGDYVVSATMRPPGNDATDPSPENTGYAPTYFPGTPNIGEAQRVTVGLSQEQSGVIFSLIATRLVRVSGSVLNSQGAPVSAGMVMLTPSGTRVGTGALLQALNGRVEQGGQFRISSVPPGRYFAQVRSNPRGPGGRGGGRGGNGLDEFARQEITVGGEDLNGVVIVTAPGGRITGQIVSDTGTLAQLRQQQVAVTARAADVEVLGPGGGGGAARVNNDWTFEIAGVFDPRLLRVNLPQGWYLKAVMLGGQDVTDTPLDVSPGQTLSGVQIVVTDKASEVNGRVIDGRGQPVTDVTIIVFADDDNRWTYQSRFVRTARPDQDGRFQIRGLPAHDSYLIIPVQNLEDGQAGDPDFLASVRESAKGFSLNENEVRALELRWAPR